MASTVTIYIQDDVRDTVEALAQVEQRSFNKMINILIQQGISHRNTATSLREALERRRPYPVTKDAPADTDMED